MDEEEVIDDEKGFKEGAELDDDILGDIDDLDTFKFDDENEDDQFDRDH